MSDNKKYYWLKLKEDFFEEDTIQWLEEQENGKDYCLFYLKLCLKSLKTNGVLIRNVGQILVPYDVKKLSDITNTKSDTVIVAMEVFKKIGLVQVLENGEIYMTQLENMVGSESKWAEKKRKQRIKDKPEDNVLKLSQKSPREIEKEIEIEIEIDKDIEKEIDEDKEYKLNEIEQSYFKTFSRTLSTQYIQRILQLLNDGLTEELIIYALEITNQRQIEQRKAKGFGYTLSILESWLNKGYKTKDEVLKDEGETETKRGGKNGDTGEDLAAKLRNEGIGL